IGNEKVYVCIPAADAASITSKLVALNPIPNIPPRTWLDVNTLRATSPPGEGPPMPNAQYVSAGIGFDYLTLAYRCLFGDPRDSALTQLALTADEMTRFVAVKIEGQALIQRAISTAKISGLVYSLSNMISPIPTDIKDIKHLAYGSNYVAVDFPRRLVTWLKLGYAGYNPFALVSNGGLPVTTPDYTTGQPATNIVGLDPNFIAAFEMVWRATIAFYAVNGG